MNHDRIEPNLCQERQRRDQSLKVFRNDGAPDFYNLSFTVSIAWVTGDLDDHVPRANTPIHVLEPKDLRW